MARVSLNNANDSDADRSSMNTEGNRGVWMNLNTEDKLTTIARNNRYPGRLGWETDHGLSGRGLMFQGAWPNRQSIAHNLPEEELRNQLVISQLQ